MSEDSEIDIFFFAFEGLYIIAFRSCVSSLSRGDCGMRHLMNKLVTEPDAAYFSRETTSKNDPL